MRYSFFCIKCATTSCSVLHITFWRLCKIYMNFREVVLSWGKLDLCLWIFITKYLYHRCDSYVGIWKSLNDHIIFSISNMIYLWYDNTSFFWYQVLHWKSSFHQNIYIYTISISILLAEALLNCCTNWSQIY